MKRSEYTKPPQWMLRFFRWFCKPSFKEDIEGDLKEMFEKKVIKYGPGKAKWLFFKDILLLFRPGIIRSPKLNNKFNYFGLIDNDLRIAGRHLLRYKGYSALTILGLAVGLATSILIFVWIMNENSYDKFHKGQEQIHQIMGNHSYPSGIETYEETPGPLAEALKELPEIEESCRLTFMGGRVLFNFKDKSIYEDGIYAESSIFKIFTISLNSGNDINPLPDNNSIAISQKLANKYFDDENAIGKVLHLNNNLSVKVTAVFDDLPENSSLQFEFIIPYYVYASRQEYITEWGAWAGDRCYVTLKKGTNKTMVNKKINELITKPKIWPRWDSNVELFLFPLNDWRLHSNFENGQQVGGRIFYVKIFGTVAIFILIIACVNFMNISTARSAKRSKEVGLRKTVGASRSTLTMQFLVESMLYTFISLGFALLFVHLLLPPFNNMMEKKLMIDFSQPLILFGLFGITVLSGLIAGSYPAFFLASFSPVNVLKNNLKSTSGGIWLRRAFVVFQYGFSVLLIFCVLVIYQQISYMRTKDLGFDKENIFYLKTQKGLLNNFESFRNEAMQNPLLKSVGLSDSNPMEIGVGLDPSDDAWPGKTADDSFIFWFLKCDYDFLETLNFTIVEGRNFSRDYATDSVNYIINEEAVKLMKLSNPVGQQVKFDRIGQIVGVVKNFNSSGLQKPIEPVLIAMRPKDTRFIFISYEPGKTEEAVNYMKTLYKKFEPDFPMEYEFMDETFESQYKDEILIGKISAYFSVVAIIISSLGLLALVSFSIESRTKEIGLRKVLGATVKGLVVMLCKEFVKLALIALIIGIPVGYYLMRYYLNQFAFHTGFNVWVFIITAFSMILITLLVVSYQSIRAALENPVNVLRNE